MVGSATFRRFLGAAVAFASLALLAGPAARGDEFILKDGKKISGTIVGFENGMFRVQTDFGFVLIQKDKVASVNISAGEKKTESTQLAAGGKGKPQVRSSSSPTASAPSAAPEPPPPAPGERAHTQVSPEANTAPTLMAPQVEGAKTPLSRAASQAAKPAAPLSHPLDVPLPADLEQHVEGNTYYSDTFRFTMYKPPDWNLVSELPKGKISPIVVLSSEDEQTLLVVDRQVWSGAPDLHNDAVEANLRESYQDYKEISQKDIRLDGHPALRRVFSGVIDSVEWHGVSVRVEDGTTVFGIIGLTSAGQYQFYESLLDKMINSFHFLAAPSKPVGQ